MKNPVPCVLFEDEHLLAVNKPAGMNTHAPAPYAGEGIYDWLRHREPRWAKLAIIHRLDKETSGVLVFAKTVVANRSLTQQFAERAVRKKYVLVTDQPVKSRRVNAVSTLIRAGDKYVSHPARTDGDRAETRFQVISSNPGRVVVEAEPITGRTHQIRVHAAHHGFPILGDSLYGGTAAERLYLHSEELILRHPATHAELKLSAPADFQADPRQALRSALIDSRETNAYRLIHGASDGWPGWYVDRFGGYLLSQSAHPLSTSQQRWLRDEARRAHVLGVYHKSLLRQVRPATREESSPQLILGDAASASFAIRENGLQLEIRFGEGCSVGLFPDQRENRRRLLTGHVAAGFPLCPANQPGGEVLNAFAYTCGFSLCAAKGGLRVTSLDLSKKYLEWGRQNFLLNGLDPDAHEFLFGDVFDWFRRLARKGRLFDVVVLDPPTFSRSKQGGLFQVEKDYGQLVNLALPLLKKTGVLFASTNAAGVPSTQFLEAIGTAIRSLGRRIVQEHYAPQPPDFPISREEPAYLKTVWLRIE